MESRNLPNRSNEQPFYFATYEDRVLKESALDDLTKLIFGKESTHRIATFRRVFDSHLREIKVLPQGSLTAYVDGRRPGVCVLGNDNTLKIHWLGFANANPKDYLKIRNRGAHELCHAIVATLAPPTKSGIQIGNKIYRNRAGKIVETTIIDNNQIHEYYGTMFNETMMDMIANMSFGFSNPNTRNVDINNILANNYTKWKQPATEYSFFTSITRLVIAAFFNDALVNYNLLASTSVSIFAAKVQTANRNILYCNDFLYGIVFNPVYIQLEYDKYMGQGEYKKLCVCLDDLFYSASKNGIIPRDKFGETIEVVMNDLPMFLNKKMDYCVNNGIINKRKSLEIIDNFNRILSSIQLEYSVYFSSNDLDNILVSSRI